MSTRSARHCSGVNIAVLPRHRLSTSLALLSFLSSKLCLNIKNNTSVLSSLWLLQKSSVVFNKEETRFCLTYFLLTEYKEDQSHLKNFDIKDMNFLFPVMGRYTAGKKCDYNYT